MKTDINRRVAISGLALLPTLGQTVFPSFAQAQRSQAAPLASWNDGPAKQAIIDFVRVTTDQTSPKFVPAEDRVATFDQDGTLWVEHPMYTQVVYCLDRVPAVVAQKPELKDREPFKTVLSGDREAMAKLSLRDLEEILLATLTGMPVDVFDAEATKWIETAKHPRWKRLYTELTYQPMLEVLQYMRANGYRTYIVTGGGQDFVRLYSQQVYGIPPEQIVGTATGTEFGYDKDGPLRCVVSDEFAERGRRPGERLAAEIGEPLLEFCIGERGSHLRVDAGDDLRWRVGWSANADPSVAFVARHELAHGGHVRQHRHSFRLRNAQRP